MEQHSLRFMQHLPLWSFQQDMWSRSLWNCSFPSPVTCTANLGWEGQISLVDNTETRSVNICWANEWMSEEWHCSFQTFSIISFVPQNTSGWNERTGTKARVCLLYNIIQDGPTTCTHHVFVIVKTQPIMAVSVSLPIPLPRSTHAIYSPKHQPETLKAVADALRISSPHCARDSALKLEIKYAPCW